MSELRQHVMVANAFETSSVLEIVKDAGTLELRERRLDRRYRKDYDSLEDPMEWPARFDISNWTLIAAFNAGVRIGGVVAARETAGLGLLEGRSDVVALWDIRVSPVIRRRGVGSALFRAIEEWARAKNCRELKVETQNTNVAACAFYARQGCHLKQAIPGAYPRLPNEVQLIWSKVVAPDNGVHRPAAGRGED